MEGIETTKVTSPAVSPPSLSQSADDIVGSFGNDGNGVPPFSLKGERYDQMTYYGRFRKMLDVVDPRTLFCSDQEIDDAVGLLDSFEKEQQCQQMNGSKSFNNRNPSDDPKLWQAKKIKDAVFHPDTNEIIPKPFRMSGFLPFNAPVCVGALLATSTPAIFFFHCANQTHNALINYNNRNATQPVEMSTVLKGYFGAVGGSVGVAMGLKTLIERSKGLSTAQKMSYQRFVALPAIISAAAINVLLMRMGELTTGIDVYYEQENKNSLSSVAKLDVTADRSNSFAPQDTNDTMPVVVGSSQIAAKKALKEMAISRMVLPLPVFLMTPVGMILAEPILKRNRRLLTVSFNTAFVLIGFGLGLPATIALFPQIGTVQASELEDRFQNLRDPQGNNVQVFRYNKGL